MPNDSPVDQQLDEPGDMVEQLILSARDGDITRARKLIFSGVDPNAVGSEGAPPLIYALAFRQKPMLKYLLENGAQANWNQETGKTPVALAAGADDFVTLVIGWT